MVSLKILKSIIMQVAGRCTQRLPHALYKVNIGLLALRGNLSLEEKYLCRRRRCCHMRHFASSRLCQPKSLFIELLFLVSEESIPRFEMHSFFAAISKCKFTNRIQREFD